LKKLGLILGACLASSAAFAQPAVTSVSAGARPNRYDGFCPVRVTFSATIVVNLPARVTYRWERSDGAVGPSETVAISGRSSDVKSYTATTSGEFRNPPGKTLRVTQVLHVTAPNDMKSNEAEIVMTCR
jgi:hypothetical protein